MKSPRRSAFRAPLLLCAMMFAGVPALLGCGGEKEPEYFVRMMAHPKAEKRRRAIEELTRKQREAQDAIRAALHSETLQIRTGALEVLAKVRRMQSVTLVGEMLNDPAAAVQVQAVKSLSALSQVWKERSVELLSQALELENPEAVRLAAQGLAEMQYDDATRVLRDAYESSEGVKSVYAARRLYAMEPELATARLLIDKLDAQDLEVRGAAMTSVYGLEQKTFDRAKAALAGKAEPTDLQALRRLYSAGGADAVYAARVLYEAAPDRELEQHMLNALTAEAKDVRQAAMGVVYGVKPGEKRERTVDGLRDQIAEPLIGYVGEHPQNQPAQTALELVRESLIYELGRILDTRRASDILMALGNMADEQSVQKLISDMDDTRLESSWRVSAARALGVAARSARAGQTTRQNIITQLSSLLPDPRVDQRVQIGAAIALCQFQQENGVQFLLDALDHYEEETAKEGITESQLRDLTSLRISAQAALTQSGEFVVSYLKERIQRKDASPTIIWAAAKTMGELRVPDVAAQLGRYVLERRTPAGQAAEGTEAELAAPMITIDENGVPSEELDLQDWQNPDPEAVAAAQKRLEVFEYPDFVRWTAAIALGRITGPQAQDLLAEAARAEMAFLAKLRANATLPRYHRRKPIIAALVRRHEDVLFYIRRAQQRSDLAEAEPAQGTGS